ncbi:MAG: GIY-YIG nuclease family protein, partial [Desulfobacterales bacterium]|nr:GIY-YIG nuclease family protein [Desulfobacterales bacterium]
SGTEGSNPSLSAKLCSAKFGEISPFCGQNGGSADRYFMYYVYILLNEAKTRTYTGVADNVEKRLEEHNSGRVKSSSPSDFFKFVNIYRLG